MLKTEWSSETPRIEYLLSFYVYFKLRNKSTVDFACAAKKNWIILNYIK